MANHGYVKTRKHMTVPKVLALLKRLNQHTFKGCLQVENWTNEGGVPTFLVQYVSKKDCVIYSQRRFWLNTRQNFEMQHRFMSDFDAWVDALICEAVGLEFNGIISDDGCSDKWLPCPDRYPTFEDYAKLTRQHFNGKIRRALVHNAMREMSVPPEFRLAGELIEFELPAWAKSWGVTGFDRIAK